MLLQQQQPQQQFRLSNLFLNRHEDDKENNDVMMNEENETDLNGNESLSAATSPLPTPNDDDDDDEQEGELPSTHYYPYHFIHHKPIRRSEEVGVPMHLRAPYINNQPFWLK